ncbi:YcbK family protein [Clostridium formicaceticum]|uniref:Peptidase M15 n=1 Tax=Clostridium formicaceticum TaxID=1497 RepID=A0AAC9RNP3_9CLOT|nr:D-Ala-D-Ala carboxypeptidase family metallohydrolase [Clostridium formicaceticum]AOY74687.1 peptidase M15 [Clostridium formicaceticum]ARE89064.1 Peptidase M15 [Clostridium formicaceticum]
MNNIQIAKNFNLKEFQCKDGNHQVRIDSQLLLKLQQLREQLNAPIFITSGYRNQEYNTKVGGSPSSQHLLGRAADIQIKGYSPQEVAKVAEAIGFNGIGIYKTFLHVDVRRGTKSRWYG